MVTSLPPPVSPHRLAHLARERFVHALDGAIVDLVPKIQGKLSELAAGGRSVRIADARVAVDALREFQRERQQWAAQVRQAWRDSLSRANGKTGVSSMAALGLVDDEVVERKIIASRVGTFVADRAGSEFEDLRLRIQSLERRTELPSHDVLQPDTLPQLLVQGWTDCGLTRPMWALIHSTVATTLAERMVEAYRRTNELLIKQGVMADIDMKSRVRRAESGGAGPQTSFGAERSSAAVTQTPFVQPSALARAAQETRMMTGVTPMARVRQRAQGVLGQLRRLISDRVTDYDDRLPGVSASPRLARALAEQVTPFEVTEWIERPGGAAMTAPMPNVQRVATQLRQRAVDLKAKADRPSEKAIIEIVALMFQAILAEERIPASIRVWFARLQIPVLRLALAEPDFFASVQHPARQLIDRMGACALGFDAAQVAGSRLEREIKRIVQVIEQYPETGRRVYQLVLDEFKRFLGRSLSENGAVQQAATLAQQVEQKEALAVQYTIELRRMLDPVPVPDEVREFLFRIWSEVLALLAVRRGAQHAETLRFKQAAVDLLWSVSPKPDRAERARVVQQLSGLLQTLRVGMAMLAIPPDEQDGYIKVLNDAVTRAFVSRSEGLPQHKLDELARSLAGLEDVVTDDPEGDLLLDPGMIELMFGVDSDTLGVITEGGSQPQQGMLEWARELELGAWFTLDYQGALHQVQYVWRSARGQLHLLSAGPARSYLVQTRRLAAYLQAGLLTPIEDEALTVRATRDALAKLNADPERLLH